MLILTLRSKLDPKPISASLFKVQKLSLKSKMDPSRFIHIFHKPVLGTHNLKMVQNPFLTHISSLLILTLRSKLDPKSISASLFKTQNWSLKCKMDPSRFWHVCHKPVRGTHNPQMKSWLPFAKYLFWPYDPNWTLSRFRGNFRKTCP